MPASSTTPCTLCTQPSTCLAAGTQGKTKCPKSKLSKKTKKAKKTWGRFFRPQALFNKFFPINTPQKRKIHSAAGYEFSCGVYAWGGGWTCALARRRKKISTQCFFKVYHGLGSERVKKNILLPSILGDQHFVSFNPHLP